MSYYACIKHFKFITALGAKIAGHRGYFLTNDGVDLNQALISYGLDYLRKKGYKKIQPPFFMNKEQMAKTAQLDQFDEELYKVLPTIHLYGRPKYSNRLSDPTTRNILLRHRNSPSRLTTLMNGSKAPTHSFQSNTPVIRHVFVKKQVPQGATCGVFSVCINLRKSSNL